MELIRPDQFDIVVAAPEEADGDAAYTALAEVGFRCHRATVDLSGLSRAAQVKPNAIVVKGFDETARDWVLNFVENNPNAPSIVAVASPEVLQSAPEWLYDVVSPEEVASALAHRLIRALNYADMKRLSDARAQELGLSRAQIRMVSMIDVVTGLFNRRYFKKHLRESHAAALRYRRPLTLLLVRVENFSSLLRALGREPTNDILDTIGLAVTSVIRQADIPSRIDDDLFAFLLPETPAEGASRLVARLLDRLKTTSYPNQASIRVATAYVQVDERYESADLVLEAALGKLPERTDEGP